MKRIQFISVLMFTTFVIFLFVGSVFAAPGTGGGTPLPPTSNYPITITNPLKGGTNSLAGFINLVLQNVVMPIGGLVAVIFIIYSGFLFVTARGNETKLATAKKAFMYAAIGTAILLGALGISIAIQNTISSITSTP